MEHIEENGRARASFLERIVRQLLGDFLYYMTIFSFGYAGVVETIRGAELAPWGFILALIVLHSHYTSDELIAVSKDLEEAQRKLIKTQREVITSLS